MNIASARNDELHPILRGPVNVNGRLIDTNQPPAAIIEDVNEVNTQGDDGDNQDGKDYRDEFAARFFS
jgi:hypothetical protein